MKRPFLNQEQRLLVRLDTANGAMFIIQLRTNQFLRQIEREIRKYFI